MESFFVFVLFIMGINCEGFYNHMENPFLEEIHGMDMRFSFGDRVEKGRVEIDNVGTTTQATHVGDNSEHVENDKTVFAPAWFDIGQFDKVGDNEQVNKINKIQTEHYQRKDKKTANKFQLKVRKYSPEYPSTESANTYTIFATPIPVEPRRRKDTKLKQPSHLKYSQRKYLMNNQADKNSISQTPTSKKPAVPALKGWDIPFTSLEFVQNSVQAPDWNSWGRHDYSDQSWARHDYSGPSSMTSKNIVVNVTPKTKSETIQKEEHKDVFKPFQNKKSLITKHNQHYIEHSIASPATSKYQPFKNSNNWNPKVLKKSRQINLPLPSTPLKVNPALSKLCQQTHAKDVIALCQANYLKINIKRRPVPAPSNRRNYQPSNNHREENITKIIATKNEAIKENKNDKIHIPRFRQSKSEPGHLFFEQNGFGRKKAKSSFLDTIASSVATLISPRHKNIFRGSRRLQGKSDRKRGLRKENWMKMLLRNNKF